MPKPLPLYPSFCEFMEDRTGGRPWVVARRNSAIVRRYGEDVHCLSRAEYDALKQEWRDGHPATRMAATLPPGGPGDWIREQVERGLV